MLRVRGRKVDKILAHMHTDTHEKTMKVNRGVVLCVDGSFTKVVERGREDNSVENRQPEKIVSLRVS